MINHTTTDFSPLSSFSGNLDVNGMFTLRQLFILQQVQILEILVAVFVFITIHSLRQKKKHGLPIWPIFGMLPSLLLAVRGNTYGWLSDVLCRQNGTFLFVGPWFTNIKCLVTADPRNLEYLLKTKFSNFPKGQYFSNMVGDLLGDGIFNVDDEAWQKQRKIASVEFHSAKFRKLTTDSLLELVHSRLLLVLEDSWKTSNSVDLQDVLLRLTFDNVCMIAFGADPGCLNQGLPEIPFAKSFEDATETTVLRFITPTFIWKVMRFFDLGAERNLKKCIKEIDEFAYEVIRTRKKELEIESNEKSDLLTVFMTLKDENGNPFSNKFLRDICVNFILAGRDTSSVALSWFFWLLDENPDVEEKILQEICKIVGERKGSDSENTGNENNHVFFKPDEIKKMDYLQAAISEALRLYPSVPVDHKQVVQDDIFPDGTVLKKGSKVIYAIYAMARMESIWGTDCKEYKPERWLRDGRFTSESAYKFAVFNGGPRLCLGKDFAYYQMKFVAASILYKYHVQVVKGQDVVPKLALTMYMKHGLKVNLMKREDTHLQKYLKKITY